MQYGRSKDGTTIAFERSGAGSPIILVGGALSERSAGAPLAALLTAYATVFTYDRRGRGDSGDTPPYAVEREIEDIAALIQAAGGSAMVFGISSGAILALEAAALGLSITRLVLYEPPFMVDDSRARLPENFTTQLTMLISSDQRGDAVERFLTQAVEMPAEVVSQMRHAPMWPAIERLAPTLIYDVTIVGDGRLPTERLAAVTIPTLVIAGEKSPAWARNAVQALAEALPGGQHRTLAGQTHNVAPEALAPVVIEFCKEDQG